MSTLPEDAAQLRRTLEQLLQARLLLAARVDELEERVELRLEALEQRVEQLQAQLEALDASFVRHQGQNEDDFRRAEASVDRVGQDLSNHLGDHWRSR